MRLTINIQQLCFRKRVSAFNSFPFFNKNDLKGV